MLSFFDLLFVLTGPRGLDGLLETLDAVRLSDITVSQNKSRYWSYRKSPPEPLILL
jgi:hypothetical protein